MTRMIVFVLKCSEGLHGNYGVVYLYTCNDQTLQKLMGELGKNDWLCGGPLYTDFLGFSCAVIVGRYGVAACSALGAVT